MSHWAHDRLLIKVRAGSQAHGLATSESDEDSRGVCVPTRECLLGLSDFEQWQSDGGDHVIYSLRKFVTLALGANPNIIETLYTEPEDRLFLHPLAQDLLDGRDRFLSRQVGVKFGRYAIHQLQKIERHYRWLTQEPPQKPEPTQFGAIHGENGPDFPDLEARKAFQAAMKHYRNYRTWRENRNAKRAELEERFGYDTKHAMHLCRLLKMGTEILRGEGVQVKRRDAQWLKSVRRGSLSYSELLVWVKQAEAELSRVEANSTLPARPDREWAESAVVEITEQYLWRGR